MTGTNLSAAPNNKTVRKSLVKNIYILYGTINKTEFPVSAAKTVTGVIILKRDLFTLLRNMSRLLQINGHDMNKRAN
jgi:hypothetical protein